MTDTTSPETDAPELVADEAPETEVSAQAEGAEAETPEPEPESKPKPKKSAQERIAELTWRANEAERQRDEALARAPKADAPKAEAEPDPADFDYGEADPKYIRALARYEAKQEFASLQAESNASAEARRVADTWSQAQAAASAKYEDYNEIVLEGASQNRWACTPAMAQAMVSAGDAGAEVAYHLASNPAESRRIASLDQISQVRELGKIEASLSAPPKVAPKTASDAPPPPKGAVRGAGGQFQTAPDTSDFAAFETLADSKLARK